MTGVAPISCHRARLAHRTAFKTDTVRVKETLFALGEAFSITPCKSLIAHGAKFAAQPAVLAVLNFAWTQVLGNIV